MEISEDVSFALSLNTRDEQKLRKRLNILLPGRVFCRPRMRYTLNMREPVLTNVCSNTVLLVRTLIHIAGCLHTLCGYNDTVDGN